MVPTVNISFFKKAATEVIGANKEETYQARDGDGRPVGSAHEEPSQDNLVEGGIWATGQEPVQL